MSDLIDREKAIDALGERPETWTDSEYELGKQNQYDGDLQAILNLKKVDAVEVVRCKDCRWSRGFATFACPMVGRVNLKDDDFCSRGERRVDE